MAIDLPSAVDRWLRTHENGETIRSYRAALDGFIARHPDNYPLAAITPEDVDDWLYELRSRPASVFTVLNRVKALKAFFNWCVRRGYLATSPARFVVVRHQTPGLRSKAIPTDVLLEMFKALENRAGAWAARDTAILSLMTTYGVRVGDVASLRLHMVNIPSGWIQFTVKGSKTLVLPITTSIGGVLADWLEYRRALDIDPSHDFVFVTIRTSSGNRHQPMTATGIGQIIYRLSEAVCGTRYGPHSIRHWRGQSLADRRVPPTVVQEILGHSDVGITLNFYYNQDHERLRAILNEFEVTPVKLPRIQ